MENQPQPNLLKSTLNYGGLLGLILVVFSMILWMLNLSLNKSLGYLSYIIIIAGLFIFLKLFRDQEMGGYISYGKALGAGLLIIVFSGLVTAAYSYILFKFIDPGLVEKMALMAEEQLYERGMTDDQIEVAVNAQKMFMKPGILAIFGLFGHVFFGFLLTLIVSIFVKKDAPPFDQV